MLGRHIGWGADDGAGLGQFLLGRTPGVQILGQAEVDNHRYAGGREQYIRRLQVAVDDAVHMGKVNGPGQELDQHRRCSGCEGSFLQFTRETAAIDVLHGEERPAIILVDLVNRDDVWVLQPGDNLRLAMKACQAFPVCMAADQDHLEGDHAPRLALPRLEHDSHAPRPKDAHDAVGSEPADFAGLLRWLQESGQILGPLEGGDVAAKR